MGGPGSEQATRHKNKVPQKIGYGDRTLMIAESIIGEYHFYQHKSHPLPPGNHWFFNPLSFFLEDNNNKSEDDNNSFSEDDNKSKCNNKKNNISKSKNKYFRKEKSIANDNTKVAMTSPPKHRRGFDTNDPTGNDYRRYRRVKTRQQWVLLYVHFFTEDINIFWGYPNRCRLWGPRFKWRLFRIFRFYEHINWNRYGVCWLTCLKVD